MAKRMVLVDEKLLDYQPTKQDLWWKRPTEQSVKSSISQQMKSTLDDPTLPEDVKAKHYTQSLSRFLHTKRKLIDEAPAVVTEASEVTPLKKKPHVSARLKRRRKSKRRESPEPEVKPTRVSLRLQRHPKPFKWDEWK